MPRYEYKHVPDTPLTRVYVDGVPDQEFTSLHAAQCWVEHTESLHQAWQDEDPRFIEAYGDECQCYGCVTMRHPCIKEKQFETHDENGGTTGAPLLGRHR